MSEYLATGLHLFIITENAVKAYKSYQDCPVIARLPLHVNNAPAYLSLASLNVSEYVFVSICLIYLKLATCLILNRPSLEFQIKFDCE
jgi:hypothetical protein